ncbi:MAG TPA: TIGR03809 family protein [Bradyrhizobium sp.]|nr:TIGR03809 family protein [Bradyrhizobium sp.]
MTSQLDVAGGRAIVARWCKLAEQRLEYLTELFETGRWRRFYSEHAFLENIQEAKAAVKTWRDLVSRGVSIDRRVTDFSWRRLRMVVPPDEIWRNPDSLARREDISSVIRHQNSIVPEGTAIAIAEHHPLLPSTL